MNLNHVALVLGAVTILASIGLFLQPAATGPLARRFPRWTPVGIALMIVATVWFLFNVSQESVADFANIQRGLLVFFAAVGLGSCIFVQDFLPIRAFACLCLLAAKVMVDAGRPWLEVTPWVYVIQIWAYVWVILGIWLTVSPWRMRDWINCLTSTPGRTRLWGGVQTALGVLVLILGLTVFRK